MKKFYTLLAAAAVTVSAASAGNLVPVSELNLNAAMTKSQAVKSVQAQPVDYTAPALRSLPNFDEDITGTFYCHYTFYDKTGTGSVEASSFTIEKGTGENAYILKNFLASSLGVQTNDINATLSLEQDGTDQYIQLNIPAGQTLCTVQNAQYKLYAGYATASGAGYDDEGDINFILYNVGFLPGYSFGKDIPGGLAFLTDQGSGGAFGETILYAANGEFKTTVTADGETGTEVNADVLGLKTSKRGKTLLTIYGITDGTNEFGPLALNCEVETGVMTATNQLAGRFYTDNSYTETFDVYYFNGDDESVMSVAANGRLQDGKTYVTFGEDLMLWADLGNEAGWMRLFVEPVINFNKDLEVCTNTAIENVAVDAVDVNAPVEFFNIQGQRIDNPANGQLVIRRQGSKVEKLIVR